MALPAPRQALIALCLVLAGCGSMPGSPREGPRSDRAAVKVAGSSTTAQFARALAEQFMRKHPEIEVRVTPTSSSDAPKALAADVSAIGMMSREISNKERDAVAARHGGKAPVGVAIAVDAIGIFVFRDNPLKSISFEELERVYGAAPRTGARVKSWGELGAAGAWSSREVVPIGFEAGRGAYDLMRELVLGGKAFGADVIAEPVSTSVVQAVAMEDGGVGYASVFFRTTRTRLLPVRNADGKVFEPTEEAIASGEYPLARALYFYVNPGAPAATQEFLRFVQSDEGRQVVKSAGGIPPRR